MGTKTTLAIAGVIATASLLTAAPAAHAEPGCVSQAWLYGGLFGRWTQRVICDGPVRADGSWNRGREFYSPSYYLPYRCSWNSYGGSCGGGYWVGEFQVGPDFYTVTDATVLGDEPGHIQ